MNLRVILGPICVLVIPLCGFYFLLTGSPFPLFQIERLNSPVKVTAINVDGLLTEDGRKLTIKYIPTIPTELPALRDAVRDGIEVDRDGYLVGRLKIHHWCGNDPVRYHLGKVNLSCLLILSGAPTNLPLPEEMIRRDDKSLRFDYGEHGLRMETFLRLGMIKSFIRTQQAEPGAPADSQSGL